MSPSSRRQAAPPRWRHILLCSLALVAGAVAAGLLWPGPKKLPPPVVLVEPPPPFISDRAFEQRNDLPVLREVLARDCARPAYVVLSSAPDRQPGSRSLRETQVFPQGLECPGVRMVDEATLQSVLKRPYHGEQDALRVGGWGSFYQAYPGADGRLALSLPVYTSPTTAVVQVGRACGPLCGAGFAVRLVKVKGQWKQVGTQPTWIS